ncbi:tRNA (adenosine(37)-N6)-dimethylallyltransferase MiaA [Maribacter cobaltidurans]|uniref:tRNA dimethylallyltransferase n=1 Tax=Maribacter cobaltidurans TaxID=1178778 RepID=A0A223V9B0_9FLAO|nr:tRNA (adenosine(37)-N6)-dimethylallyltransferase MiaA [Maribacter cobaltidurans]ASV31995.1 tRNA (adenosine(37)-N6)-dimethylallyltransferase MiaA [Maribacter cobaltidurans]GGD86313.1 tRNA dimethylallyltransferase [Maribacter cobaltidurans]
MNKVLISVTGPTAIGKTRLGILLANHFNTEIISADSRQFYKEMSIGTAVPTKHELTSAVHHFIQHKSIHEPYSVGDFEKDALKKLDELFQDHEVVIMVGGSGLYVDAITKGLDAFPKVGKSIRENLNKQLTNDGIEILQNMLSTLDPEHYNRIDIHNPHRLIRALEICIGTGRPYSSFLNKPKDKRNFKVLSVGLKADRTVVYERINERVDLMMKEGLLDEVKLLKSTRDLNALQTVGYKELFEYLDGNWTLDFAISEIKKNTRRFAKRQNTWFKKSLETLYVDYNYKENEILAMMDKAVMELQHERT